MIVLDRDIAQFDIFAEMFDEAQPVFSATTLSDFLNENKDATEIIVDIRSDGGSTSEARIIYDMLKNCGKKVITKGYKVNSSAVVVFLAGDERLIAENSDFLIHPVWIDAMGLPWMLTGDDLQDFANEIKKEEAKLLDLYMSVIGEDNRGEVSLLMEGSTNLSVDQCMNLGFATGKLEEAGLKSENKRAVTFNNRMAALVLKNKNQSNNDMKIADALKNLTGSIEKLINKSEGEGSPEPTNMSVEVDGGDAIHFDGTEISEGTAVFTDEGMESPVADGDYTLADGRKISVADGFITGIEVAEPVDDGEAVNAKIDALESSLESKITEQNDHITELAENLANLVDTLAEFKNLVPADKGTATPVKTTQNKKPATVAQAVANRAKQD